MSETNRAIAERIWRLFPAHAGISPNGFAEEVAIIEAALDAKDAEIASYRENTDAVQVKALVGAARYAIKGLNATIANYNQIITGKPNCVIDDDDMYGWQGDKRVLENALVPFNHIP